VPSRPSTKARGLDTGPGSFSGNQWKSTSWNSEIDLPVAGFTAAPETTDTSESDPLQERPELVTPWER